MDVELKIFMTDLCFICERPKVSYFLNNAVSLLRLARVDQRWNVVVVMMPAAQQLSFARIQSDTCTKNMKKTFFQNLQEM